MAKDRRDIRALIEQIPFYSIWWTFRRLSMVFIGALIAALGYSMFQIPFQIVAGGVSGVGIIINHFTGLPEGILFLLLNIPIMILGYFHLGRWRFLLYTATAVVTFSVMADMFTYWLPQLLPKNRITDDMLLSGIYAGLVFGLGTGLIIRANGTIGGTTVIARIFQIKTGIPISQIYLYTDGLIIFASGLIFGWERALIALLTLFIGGIANDYIIEGPSFVRTAMIVTNYPDDVSRALMIGLNKGVSHWEIVGSYTGQKRSMVFCIIYRSQVQELKQVVAAVDENAFVVIEQAHQALGSGFISLRK